MKQDFLASFSETLLEASRMTPLRKKGNKKPRMHFIFVEGPICRL